MSSVVLSPGLIRDWYRSEKMSTTSSSSPSGRYENLYGTLSFASYGGVVSKSEFQLRMLRKNQKFLVN